MQIVFVPESVEDLRTKYTLLELDTITIPGRGEFPAYCVLEPEHVIMEIGALPLNISLHEQLVAAMHRDDAKVALEMIPQLRGKFRGELDSFYDILEQRIADTGSCKLSPVTA